MRPSSKSFRTLIVLLIITAAYFLIAYWQNMWPFELTYSNGQYGFHVEFTEADYWKGYRVNEGAGIKNGMDSISFEFPYINDAGETMWGSAMNILVYSQEKWAEFERFGESPLSLFLDQNEDYVFSLVWNTDPRPELSDKFIFKRDIPIEDTFRFTVAD